MNDLLNTYRNGGLFNAWQELTNNIIASDIKYQNSYLSTNRAGELAAAQLAYEAGAEIEALEAKVNHGITDAEADLYDWLFVYDNNNIKSELIDMSGTRTLIADMLAEV